MSQRFAARVGDGRGSCSARGDFAVATPSSLRRRSVARPANRRLRRDVVSLRGARRYVVVTAMLRMRHRTCHEGRRRQTVFELVGVGDENCVRSGDSHSGRQPRRRAGRLDRSRDRCRENRFVRRRPGGRRISTTADWVERLPRGIIPAAEISVRNRQVAAMAWPQEGTRIAKIRKRTSCRASNHQTGRRTRCVLLCLFAATGFRRRIGHSGQSRSISGRHVCRSPEPPRDSRLRSGL